VIPNLHRLTLRQINENPTLMSDEVFVPAEEADELVRQLETVERSLLSNDAVHVAMLRGTIARISMSQCAHTWGEKMVEDWNRASELRADLKTVSDVLRDYEGHHVWEQAQECVETVSALNSEIRRLRGINESNCNYIEDLLAELREAKKKIEALEATKRLDELTGGSHDKAKEQASGTEEQERSGD
jgi:hypothetical protein